MKIVSRRSLYRVLTIRFIVSSTHSEVFSAPRSSSTSRSAVHHRAQHLELGRADRRVVGAADDAEELARVVEQAARAGRLDHLLQHGDGEVRLADAGLAFEQQPAALLDDGKGVGEPIRHAPRLIERRSSDSLYGGEVRERAVLIALRDVRVGEPMLSDLLAPAVAADDASNAASRRPASSRCRRTADKASIGFYQFRCERRLAERAQLFFRARFDLPDALAREMQLVADLLQRARLVVFEPEPQAHDLPLLAVELAERRRELVEIRLMDHLVLDRRDAVLLEHVAQLARRPSRGPRRRRAPAR